jgi:hypothetical protein
MLEQNEVTTRNSLVGSNQLFHCSDLTKIEEDGIWRESDEGAVSVACIWGERNDKRER